ncbi:helix-turn-helix domain-containing protein [Paenibacillus tarimensis]
MQTTEIVQRGIDFIEEHLQESLALDEIAEAASMSLPNLYRMFYAMTGHPIKEYIRKRRTSEAAIALRQTFLPMIEIGFNYGFETYQTFIKTFKRNTGLTPGQYRQSDLIYSFERIDLYERVQYLEERKISERYPGIQVIRLAPLKGIGYLHTAEREIGLEDEAITKFQALLTDNQMDLNQFRLFGWNVDFEDSQHPFGYQMVAVSEKVHSVEHPIFKNIELPGGLYAVTRTPLGDVSTIVAAWNRLLSEWLPRSTFTLGEHGFLEEYQKYNGQIARLKLYLPVKRDQITEAIEIVERPSIEVTAFRAEGNDCVIDVDEASADFLIRNKFVGDSRLQVFMSCSFPPGEINTYELYIQTPDCFVPLPEDAHRAARLEGGLYACFQTVSYGLMIGVLERIYLWLGTSAEYEPDGSRSWYVHYEQVTGSANTRVQQPVRCYVPVILRN